MPGGRPPKYTNVEDMQKDIDVYFDKCKKDKQPKTVMGLAIALDMCRETLCDYAKKGAFSDTVKRAKDIVVAEVESMLLKPGANTTGAIFWMKNNGGMRDKIQQEVSGPDGGPIEVKGIDITFTKPDESKG
jgi:hypothetical protein